MSIFSTTYLRTQRVENLPWRLENFIVATFLPPWHTQRRVYCLLLSLQQFRSCFLIFSAPVISDLRKGLEASQYLIEDSADKAVILVHITYTPKLLQNVRICH